MAPYRQAPPPDWVGWGADVPYTPANAPLSGGYRWDEDYDDLTDPEPYAPPRSTTPPGQFLISLLEARKRLPKPVPPGRCLPSIGVHLPQPQTVLPMRPFFPPPPPLTPLEPAVDHTGMTVPTPMVPPANREHVAGLGATPSRMPAEFERTQGDGVILNTTAGANEAIYDTLGLPVDAMTWLLNQGLDGVNYATGSDFRIRDPFLGSRWFAHRGASVGIPDPASIVAVTPTERIARGTGAGAAYAVAPATMVRGGAALSGRQLGPLWESVFGRAGSAGELGRDMAIGADRRRHRHGHRRTGAGAVEADGDGRRRFAGRSGGGTRSGAGSCGADCARPAGGAEQRGHMAGALEKPPFGPDRASGDLARTILLAQVPRQPVWVLKRPNTMASH